MLTSKQNRYALIGIFASFFYVNPAQAVYLKCFHENKVMLSMDYLDFYYPSFEINEISSSAISNRRKFSPTTAIGFSKENKRINLFIGSSKKVFYSWELSQRSQYEWSFRYELNFNHTRKEVILNCFEVERYSDKGSLKQPYFLTPEQVESYKNYKHYKTSISWETYAVIPDAENHAFKENLTQGYEDNNPPQIIDDYADRFQPKPGKLPPFEIEGKKEEEKKD